MVYVTASLKLMVVAAIEELSSVAQVKPVVPAKVVVAPVPIVIVSSAVKSELIVYVNAVVLLNVMLFQEIPLVSSVHEFVKFNVDEVVVTLPLTYFNVLVV